MELEHAESVRRHGEEREDGAIMAEVVVDVGGQERVAAVTRGGVEHLALSEGDAVVVLIKATEVMLGK